jgi:hypothetical protein
VCFLVKGNPTKCRASGVRLTRRQSCASDRDCSPCATLTPDVRRDGSERPEQPACTRCRGAVYAESPPIGRRDGLRLRCELGDPSGYSAAKGARSKAEFDAQCYRSIFSSEFADTDFLSVGNEADVRSDRLGVGHAIQTLVAGTHVVRLVDRADRSTREIDDLQAAGVRVLSRRHIEAHLLDDEVLAEVCRSVGKPGELGSVLRAKADALARGSDGVIRGTISSLRRGRCIRR